MPTQHTHAQNCSGPEPVVDGRRDQGGREPERAGRREQCAIAHKQDDLHSGEEIEITTHRPNRGSVAKLAYLKLDLAI